MTGLIDHWASGSKLLNDAEVTNKLAGRLGEEDSRASLNIGCTMNMTLTMTRPSLGRHISHTSTSSIVLHTDRLSIQLQIHCLDKNMSTSTRSLLVQHNGKIRFLEVHDQGSKEIVRNVVGDDGEYFQGVWMSGLTQTTCLGVPDTELLSPLKRASLIDGLSNNLQQNNRRPLCAAYDADGGGNIADVPALVALLASIGVSMIVTEDKSICKPGEKANFLTEPSNWQAQANTHDFVAYCRLR